MPDVFQYDVIPKELRIQIIHIIHDIFGKEISYNKSCNSSEIFKFFQNTLCREYGLFSLADHLGSYTPESDVIGFLLNTKNEERAIDVVELVFGYINFLAGDFLIFSRYVETSSNPEKAIEELNDRFKEHGVGYQFESGSIVRIDSKFIHAEVVKPALKLLMNSKFAGANEEYRKAHDHYKKGKNKECLAECLKAFESTMKIICTEKGWAFKGTDTAKKLINVCMQNGLIPSYAQNQFSSLKTLLETGVPPVRNKMGGHGQGQIPQRVEDEIARYALNLTGANVIFLVELSGIQ